MPIDHRNYEDGFLRVLWCFLRLCFGVESRRRRLDLAERCESFFLRR